jgi:hypothetical protein
MLLSKKVGIERAESKADVAATRLGQSKCDGEPDMRKSNFALRLQPSLLEEARKLAEAEGVALNQFINVAVAEKLSVLRTESYLSERAVRADLGKVLQILARAGAGNKPMQGDELPGTEAKSRKRRR